jgi:PPP family 3-phenylpropionic acid transporter
MPAAALLSLVWLFVLGGLGLFFPFYSLYLSQNAHLSGTQIGIVVAIPPLTGIFAQPFWGQLSDRTGSRSRVLAFLAAAAALGYAGLALPERFVGFALGTFLLALFSVALIPSLVATSLALLRERGSHAFGRVRVWGTVGFALSVGGFPFLLDAIEARAGLPAAAGEEPFLWLMFPSACCLVAVAAILALVLPRGGAEAVRAERGDWRLLLRHGPFLRLLSFTFVTFLCLQGPMVLFPILVRARGGGLDALSHMWLLMISLEIPLVALLGASVARLGLRGVVSLGILASAIRWLVSGYSESLGLVTAVQVLHGVGVWGLILGLPLCVDRVVPERLRSTAQGFLAMIGLSLGSTLSNLLSGWLVEHVGAAAPARLGGLAAVVLLLAGQKLLPPLRRD